MAAAGDPPSLRLQSLRIKQGSANLRLHLSSITTTFEPLMAAEFAIRARPPRDIDAIEVALLDHLGAVENALHWVRLMRLNRDRPVSMREMTALDPELREALT